MAQTLQQRLASARDSDRTTIETLAKLIEDVRAEQERLTAAHERASGESIDFALSEDDREEAAANAGRYARSLAALASAAEDLEVKLEAKRNSTAQRAKEAEKAAALAERNEIAARFAKRVPAITGELIELLKAVQANAGRMRAAGIHETNAELHARGLPGNGRLGPDLVAQFLEIKIPDFHGAGRVWPLHEIEARASAARCAEQTQQNYIAQREAEAKRQRDKAEAAAKFAAEHGTYRLSVPSLSGDSIVRIPAELATGNIPAALGCWEFRQLVIAHTVAEQLAKVPYLKVERVDRGGKQ